MKRIIQLALWILILQLISYGMGMITRANLDPWYISLSKSSLTPPGYIFGIVWSILYIILAIVGWQLYQKTKLAEASQLQVVFISQLILNELWTPLFFYLHWPGASLICSIAIALLTSKFLMLAWTRARLLFWLMIPYWIWVIFASYLNFFIWCKNT